jgi:hypothetical protein
MSRFFLVVVEVEKAPALIQLLECPQRLAGILYLPEGCRFRTCFEIGADYANVIIDM